MPLIQNIIYPSVLSLAACQRPYLTTFEASRQKVKAWGSISQLAVQALSCYYLNGLLSSTFSQYKHTPLIKKVVVAVTVATSLHTLWKIWRTTAVVHTPSQAEKTCESLKGYAKLVLWLGAVGCNIYRLRDRNTRTSAVAVLAGQLLVVFGEKTLNKMSIPAPVDRKRFGVGKFYLNPFWISLGALACYNRFKG